MQQNQKNNVAYYVKEVSDNKGIAQCPQCENARVEKMKSKKGTHFYACKNTEYDFIIFESMAGSKLNQTHVKELITQRKTKSKVKGFKSKKGNQFDAYVELNNEFKTQFKF